MRALTYHVLPLLLTVGWSSGPATAKTPVTANGSKPGAYDVKHADGTVTRTILNANGTYRDLTAKGKLDGTGKWSVTHGKMCFAPSKKGDQAMCFKESPPAKDGSFTATPDKGKPVTVSPAAK
jgi:hypothetical protein